MLFFSIKTHPTLNYVSLFRKTIKKCESQRGNKYWKESKRFKGLKPTYQGEFHHVALHDKRSVSFGGEKMRHVSKVIINDTSVVFKNRFVSDFCMLWKGAEIFPLFNKKLGQNRKRGYKKFWFETKASLSGILFFFLLQNYPCDIYEHYKMIRKHLS